jgi:acetylornithine deacetylase/succinyl-diaminopimelate desuccinylase-like protein
MCILGEPTDMKVVLQHFGSLWVRISTRGMYVHTAFAAGRDEENSIRRMHRVLQEIVEWIPSWEETTAAHTNGISLRGMVNIGCIRGGDPWRASRTPQQTDLFVDVRVPPSMPMAQARRSVKELFLALRKKYPDYGLEFEAYVSVPGASISPEHEMVKAIAANHRRIMGEPPAHDAVLWCSDASVLTRYGVETVNYGPSSGPRDHEGEKVRIQTLVDITKIYALTAAQICGVA